MHVKRGIGYTGALVNTDPKADENEGVRGPRGLAIMAAFAAILTVADLVTKHLAFSRIGPYPNRVTVFDSLGGFLSFDLVNSVNRGAAFGIGQGAFGFFAIVSIAALGLLGYFSWTALRSGVGYQLTLGAVTSGVLGNLHDRLTFRGVRDFLDVYIVPETGFGQWLIQKFGTPHWPTFNVADACICVGTVLLVMKFYRDEKHEKKLKEIHDYNAPYRKRSEQQPGG